MWKPTSNLTPGGTVDLTGLASVKLQVGKVVDGRKDPMLLGANKEDAVPRIITTTDDVPAFVTDQNYYETLSDSLIQATNNLIGNPGFRAALAKQ